MSTSCPACGARVEDSDAACPLCGTAVAGGSEEAPETETRSSETEQPAPGEISAGETGSVYCNQCGHANPSGSRFCSACGARLHAPATSMVPPAHEPKAAVAGDGSSVGGRLGVIFGAALAVVVIIFLFGALREGDSAAPATQAVQQGGVQQMSSEEPLPAGITDQLEAIRGEAESLEGDARIAKLREGVELLRTLGRYDRAAVEQEAIAEQTGSEKDWVETGNHYYDWMATHSGRERAEFAVKTIAAYQKVLAINPDNLDARADMAFAYLSDRENPMQAVQELTAVLAADSLHVRANHFRGIMLLEIGRAQEALGQFRKVQRLIGDPGQPLYRQAGEYIQYIEEGLAGAPVTG